MNKNMTFGVIVGNRGFFPDHLAKSGREEMIAALEKAGHKAIVLGPGGQQTRRGGDARRGQEVRRAVRRQQAARSTA